MISKFLQLSQSILQIGSILIKMSIEESDFFLDHETLESMKILSKQVNINYAFNGSISEPRLASCAPYSCRYVSFLIIQVNQDKDVVDLIQWLRVPPKHTIIRINLMKADRNSIIGELRDHLTEVSNHSFSIQGHEQSF